MADVPYRQTEAHDRQHSALERIDRAIARIEAASVARTVSGAALAKRHDVLRERMAEAIAGLDAVLAGAGDDA